jgi:hypothetical protein
VKDFEVSEVSSTDKDQTRYSYMYYPIFSYSVNGKKYENKSRIGTNRKRFQVGEMVTVFYNPSEPGQYYVAEDQAAKRGPYYFLGFGILIVIIFIGVLVFMGDNV